MIRANAALILAVGVACAGYSAIQLVLASALPTKAFAENKKLDSVALTVGDLANPFFVQVSHGAEAKAKQINVQ